MFHFFAKLGRKEWTKSVVPLATLMTTSGYLGIHFLGHDLVRNLLSAQKPSGGREDISENLQGLIMEVYDDIKDVFNIPIIKTSIQIFKITPPTIKWFATSNIDPVNFGMAETKTGVLIGLPNYYNYDTENDLPSNIFEIRSIKLFKNFTSPKKKDSSDVANEFSESHIEPMIRIDKNSPDGQNYVTSMILSQNAKRFSIARELFYADSSRPLLMSGIIAISMLLPLFLSRAVVSYLRLADAHLTQRLPFYIVSGFAGLGNYGFLADSTNEYYSMKADERAIEVNQSYKEGAVEYFTKMIQRNIALRNLVENMEHVYDKDGNVKEPLLRRRHVPVTVRLALANKTENATTG